MDSVILVDENDNAIGTMEKMEAHIKGQLHRAFSIVVFNSRGEMLIQKRASTKYHSGGLWTNTCCSHPTPKEEIELTVKKRLLFEMGIELSPKFAYKFMYHTRLDQNLIEHEVDYVFKGVYDGDPLVNAEEVEDWKFISMNSLVSNIARNPDSYTYWFKLMIEHPEFHYLVSPSDKVSSERLPLT
ncbi:MAG: isopentenyl-diphosphate Delta-isomerase [Cyclobacteriaceae bacterium]|nr:isopentenyl-diphosphate Delta-isomerase [Cyclobacteriaceae bacterium]